MTAPISPTVAEWVEWIVIVGCLIALASHYACEYVAWRARREARWVAQSDADFAEHADEALNLCQPESLDDYLARHCATYDELVFAVDVLADIDELPEVSA